MASTGARRELIMTGGRTPSRGHGLEATPPEDDKVFVFKSVDFSMHVLREKVYCLSCFCCAYAYGFTISSETMR